MPLYEFQCKKCEKRYSELTAYDATGRYAGAACPECGSKRKTKLVSMCHAKFSNPKESSKWDSFSYRAGYLMEGAKDERRAAEAASHMGGTQDIYGPGPDDLNNDAAWDLASE